MCKCCLAVLITEHLVYIADDVFLYFAYSDNFNPAKDGLSVCQLKHFDFLQVTVDFIVIQNSVKLDK